MAKLDFTFPKLSEMRELSFTERGDLQRDLDMLLNSNVPWQKHTLFFSAEVVSGSSPWKDSKGAGPAQTQFVIRPMPDGVVQVYRRVRQTIVERKEPEQTNVEKPTNLNEAMKSKNVERATEWRGTRLNNSSWAQRLREAIQEKTGLKDPEEVKEQNRSLLASKNRVGNRVKKSPF